MYIYLCPTIENAKLGKRRGISYLPPQFLTVIKDPNAPASLARNNALACKIETPERFVNVL